MHTITQTLIISRVAIVSIFSNDISVNSNRMALSSSPDVKLDDLETTHFVLVHGGGFGAWCWYKTIALLEEAGFKFTAVDLTGSRIHSSDTNAIASLSQYVKPLTDFLEKLTDGETGCLYFLLFLFFLSYLLLFQLAV